MCLITCEVLDRYEVMAYAGLVLSYAGYWFWLALLFVFLVVFSGFLRLGFFEVFQVMVVQCMVRQDCVFCIFLPLSELCCLSLCYIFFCFFCPV